MQDYFAKITAVLDRSIQKSEVYTANFSGEDSDFVRFNQSQVRQAGHVTQRYLSIDLIEGRRHVGGTITLSGEFESDQARVQALVRELREKRAFLPEDPYLLYSTEPNTTETNEKNRLPDGASAVAAIQDAGRGRDLVGIYAAGGIYSGFANSLGQRNWYSNYSYNFDWSFYHRADKAVKNAYAGFEWSPTEFDRKVQWAAEQLDVLSHPAKTINPGRYRVYLAPAALYDLVGTLNWGGFGLKAHKTKTTPLIKMIEGDERLDRRVTLVENVRGGVSPNFQEAGFIKPDAVTMISQGSYRECLVSPRSAKEYGVPTNGASSWEQANSLDMSAGGLALDRVLRDLDTGVFVNNLWYLNYSDRSACRTTGMTRFATFWVEHGRIVAPLNVMRFDETLYRVLGRNLVDLTSEREMMLDSGSYGRRSTESALLPGALINDFTFTL
jgi:predicted Zn-dependent protease